MMGIPGKNLISSVFFPGFLKHFHCMLVCKDGKPCQDFLFFIPPSLGLVQVIFQFFLEFGVWVDGSGMSVLKKKTTSLKLTAKAPENYLW